MSTKKIRDVASKQATASSFRTKTTREHSNDRKKKEEKTSSKPRTISRTQKKEDEDQVKKPPLKPQNSVRKVSRPLVANTPKVSSKSKSERPVTPPSSRVTKTQYFPSKKLYHNALTSEDLEKIKSASKLAATKKKPASRKTETQEEVSSEASSISERPRTATLRKGSIVNNNIVGPEVPKKNKTASKPAEVTKKPKREEIVEEYEDDFESYESDFEEYNSCSSTTSNIASVTESSETDSTEQETPPKRVSSAGTDDEKKLDSGNYELPEFKHRQILDKIKESIEKENTNLNQEQRSNMGSLSDEGFEDGKSLQFINFLGAQKKYKDRKSMEIRRKRGEEILNMIRLDHYSFTLLDFAPVPYDIFIKTFGKSNTVQVSVQTGEDDLDEETQTEVITSTNKWTQFPSVYTQTEQTGDENFWKIYKCNYLGVGGDEILDKKVQDIENETSLERFLLSTGNLILNIQAEENIKIEENSQTKSNVPFSKGYILYDTRKLEVLKTRPINDISFCPNNPNKILTAHGHSEDFNQSVICLWNISNVKEPEMLLVSYGEVSCVSFGLECNNLVFSGCKDGTVSVWDIKESLAHHKTVEHQIDSFPMRTPTFFTEVNRGHSGKVVAILSLSNSSKEEDLFAEHKNSEVCSLDEDGDVIIWSVIFKEPSRGKILENQGLAHWGAVIITINTKISLGKLHPEVEDFKCTDLALSHFDSSHLFISTSYGVIIHCLANGGRTSVKKFLPDTFSQANCLEMCPFSPQYIIAGFDNGDINFYSRAIERPLMVLSNKDSVAGGCKIQKIQWSYNHPLIFYTKDVTNTIHVWNLKVSDMFPVYSVPFKDKIISMKLSPVVKNNDDVPEKTYMIIATEKGAVFVHLLDDDHGQQSLQEFEDDKKKFFNYISRYV